MFANLWIFNCISQLLGDPEGSLCPGNLIKNGTFWFSTPQQIGGTANYWTLYNADVHDVPSVYNKINEPRNPFIDLVSVGVGSGGYGSAQQTVTTVPYKNYNLSFNLGSDLQTTTDLSGRTVKVGITDGVSPEVVYTYDLTASKVIETYEDFDWQTFNFDYIPTTNTTTITFSGFTEKFAYGPVLDNVCFVLKPIPFTFTINTTITQN